MAVYEELMESYFGNEELTRLSFGLLRSAALFAGSVVLMRLYGDSMAV